MMMQMSVAMDKTRGPATIMILPHLPMVKKVRESFADCVVDVEETGLSEVVVVDDNNRSVRGQWQNKHATTTESKPKTRQGRSEKSECQE